MAVREFTEEETRQSSKRMQEAILEGVLKELAAAERKLAHSREWLEYLKEQKAS
jgi:hypothetical protein